jgi:nitroimidazol reductase NimA-like FMN-containing flavoprotein (pyridoxamine 5'-phosphate oxidase superfamily)
MSGAGRSSELFQLTESTCIALLGVQHVGRLIVPGDDPYVIPVNYSAVDGAVVFRTERRPVIEAIHDRPVVFEVDMFDDRSKSGWSVVVRGRAHDITARTDLDRDTVIGTTPTPWAPGDRDCVMRITPERVTGRLLRGEIPPRSLGDTGYL